METIGFDALTAAAIAHHLDTRRLHPGLVAWLMLEAARETRQASRHGVQVKIAGWTSMGDAIVPGGDSGVMTMKVEMSPRGGAPRVTAVGRLSRTRAELRYVTGELGLADKARFARSHDGGMRLELRQRLPDTLLSGATALVGGPLSRLVGHDALLRPEADGILITGVCAPGSRVRTRVDLGMGGKEGLDFTVSAPEVQVAPGC